MATVQAAGVGGALVAFAGVTAGAPVLAVAGLAVEVVCVARVIRYRWRRREHT